MNYFHFSAQLVKYIFNQHNFIAKFIIVNQCACAGFSKVMQLIGIIILLIQASCTNIP